MGTYYPISCCGRRELIDHLTADTNNYTRKARYCSGNTLWVWWQPKSNFGQDFIGCYLLTHYKGDWGYKPLEESMHPYYYSCPKSWLNSVPVVDAEWREGVVRYWDKRAAKRRSKCK